MFRASGTSVPPAATALSSNKISRVTDTPRVAAQSLAEELLNSLSEGSFLSQEEKEQLENQ